MRPKGPEVKRAGTARIETLRGRYCSALTKRDAKLTLLSFLFKRLGQPTTCSRLRSAFNQISPLTGSPARSVAHLTDCLVSSQRLEPPSSKQQPRPQRRQKHRLSMTVVAS